MSSNAPTNTLAMKNTNGFYFQAVASFVISAAALMIAIVFLPLDPWTRSFLAIATLFMVSSTITISKVIRDREEAASVYNRVDAARLEKILAEYDPLQPISLGAPQSHVHQPQGNGR